MASSGLRANLSEVEYRDLLDIPGIARVHDYQRAFSYGLGAVAMLTIGAATWRTTAVLILCGVMTGAATWRLISKRTPAPFPLGMVDVVSAPVIVAIGTASPLVALLVAMVIGFSVTATFDIPIGHGIAGSLVSAALAMSLAEWVSRQGTAGSSGVLVGFIVVALMLVIAIVIVAFVTMQSQTLRRTLSYRERELRAVLSVTPVVLATVDPEGAITAVAGEDSDWLGAPGQHVPAALADVISQASDGTRRDEDVTVGSRVFSVSCVPGPHGAVLLTAFEITDREAARRQLEQLVHSKDSFVAAISHELRTPLTAVLGFAEETRLLMDPSHPAAASIEIIAEQSAEMAAIIEDLLVAARADLETITLVAERVDLAAEAATVAAALDGRLSALPSLELDSAPALGDPVRIRQIIRNLLTNADRYGGRSVALCTGSMNGVAVLEVRDNGPAVDAPERDRIFEPYQSAGPVKGQPAAIGLGLTVSRRLAGLMGGDLTYDHVDGWSVFRLTVPALVTADV